MFLWSATCDLSIEVIFWYHKFMALQIRKMAKRVKELPTASADNFLESSIFDKNGNLMRTLYIQGNKHDILLCHHSKPARNQGAAEKLQKIKDNMNKVKSKILSNVKDNIEDPMSESSWYYNWSGLDLELTICLNACVDKMRDHSSLHHIKVAFCAVLQK